jgi:hypothetical protein
MMLMHKRTRDLKPRVRTPPSHIVPKNMHHFIKMHDSSITTLQNSSRCCRVRP